MKLTRFELQYTGVEDICLNAGGNDEAKNQSNRNHLFNAYELDQKK
ncbi:hypothetical protein [Guptibacillus algicola]|nr:hypothetical protein [Alkalihalobacillus algicola]MCA0987466.1 hypothetical protein [Alkalihalobacillus algicola]